MEAIGFMAEILVFTTTDSAELAQRIAQKLVESGEAACVNIVPAIRSIYRWQGKLCDESENLLVVKTSQARFESVRATIRRLHSYQVPEIIALPIVLGDAEYLQWIRDQTPISESRP
jgi:periplasmic divalent cation tolerance protein